MTLSLTAVGHWKWTAGETCTQHWPCEIPLVPRLEETYQHLLLCYLYSPPNRSRQQHTAMIFCATYCDLQRGGLFFRYIPIPLNKHFGLYIQNSTCKVKVTSLPPSNEPYISNTFSTSTIPSEETGFSIPQRSNLPENKNKSVPERKSLKLQKSGVAGIWSSMVWRNAPVGSSRLKAPFDEEGRESLYCNRVCNLDTNQPTEECQNVCIHMYTPYVAQIILCWNTNAICRVKAGPLD